MHCHQSCLLVKLRICKSLFPATLIKWHCKSANHDCCEMAKLAIGAIIFPELSVCPLLATLTQVFTDIPRFLLTTLFPSISSITNFFLHAFAVVWYDVPAFPQQSREKRDASIQALWSQLYMKLIKGRHSRVVWNATDKWANPEVKCWS